MRRPAAQPQELTSECSSCRGRGMHSRECVVLFYTTCFECGAQALRRGEQISHLGGCSFITEDGAQLAGADALVSWIDVFSKNVRRGSIRDVRRALISTRLLLPSDASEEEAAVRTYERVPHRDQAARAMEQYLANPEDLPLDGQLQPPVTEAIDPQEEEEIIPDFQRLHALLPVIAPAFGKLTRQRVLRYVGSLSDEKKEELDGQCALWATLVRRGLKEVLWEGRRDVFPVSEDAVYDLVLALRQYRRWVFGTTRMGQLHRVQASLPKQVQ